MDDDALERTVADLVERVERLERGAHATGATDLHLAQSLVAELKPDAEGEGGPGSVVYAGAGPWEDGVVAWQMTRTWPEVLTAAGAAAPVFAALANVTRLRIVAELMAGPVTTADLARRLDQPSSGQLFHHLKDLLAAGLIHQPVRGSYAVRRQHALPLLAAMSAALDVAPPTSSEPA